MFLKNRESMRQIGLACFVLAQATHFLIRPASTPARDLVDGIFGLLLGISIGLLLLSLRRRRESSAPPPGSIC
jgi:uncharacterized membrane protein YhhN